MAQGASAPSDAFAHLETARKLTLADAAHYSQIVPAILPTLAYENNATVEVRRWGAEFLAETFASPALSDAQKEELCLIVLPFIRGVLELAHEDAVVVKNTIQAVASFYTLLFRSIVTRPDDFFTKKAIASKANAWNTMSVIKSSILKRMDSAPTNVRVCAIKFTQKVIQVQTPGVIADPRRPERNETSVTIVSRNDPLLKIPLLEAEASGLLDRLLNVFQENSSDPILVDATLNCVAILIRSRTSISSKIINSILNFNPLKLANSPMTPRLKVIARSLERTTRALLKNINKNNPNGPLAPRIDAYLVHLNESRANVFVETQTLKRPAVFEGPDGLEAKRLKLEGTTKYPPLPPPPNSYAQLFTLTEDPAFMNFDVQILNHEMVKTIAQLTMYHADANVFDQAVAAVRERYTHLQKIQQPTPVPDIPMAGPTGVDDEDDYDPELIAGDSPLESPTTATAQALHDLVQPELALGPFELSRPPPLSNLEASLLAKQSVERVFTHITTRDTVTPASAGQKLGLNRLAATSNDRDAWVTILTRLATRAPSGLESLVKSETTGEEHASVKTEPDPILYDPEENTLANNIRQTICLYVLDDFRSRLNIAISWLNEEWYHDRLSRPSPSPSPSHSQPQSTTSLNPSAYTTYTLRILDSILPYLDMRDSRLLIRFLSEIPTISLAILERVKSLARDPERVSMCLMALQYLILMRPPVREMAVDAVQSIWAGGEEYAEARAAAGKVLGKYRPAALVEREGKGRGLEGVSDKVEAVGKIVKPETVVIGLVNGEDRES